MCAMDKEGKKMSFAYAMKKFHLKQGVSGMTQEPTVAEIKQILGIDKMETIKVSATDASDRENDADYFKDWYEDELKKFYEDNR